MRPGLYVTGDGSVVAYTGHESGRRRVAFAARWMDALLLTPQFLAEHTRLSFELCAREISEIWFIPYDDWHVVEGWSTEVRDFTTSLLSGQVGFLTFGLYAQMEKNISKRLALYLNRLHDSMKENGDTVYISHEELAELTGTTREAVTRNLNILKDAGLIQTGRSRIRILDAPALRTYINLQPQPTMIKAEGKDEKIYQFYRGDVHGSRNTAHGGG